MCIFAQENVKFIVNMAKVLGENIVKCGCGKHIEYGASDITTNECGYGVGTYQGETYMGKFITCPNCGRKIEVY